VVGTSRCDVRTPQRGVPTYSLSPTMFDVSLGI
jgi:hypothetical protein